MPKQGMPQAVIAANASNLFPKEITPGRVSVAFRRVCNRAKIADFRFHDLRHTAASWLRMTGADIHSVATLLGHKDIRMTTRYSHLNPAFLGETIGKLDAVFDNLRCQDVANQKLLTDGDAITVESNTICRYGVSG